MIPSENHAGLLNPPPANHPERTGMAFRLVFIPDARASRLIPGSGTTAPSRYRAIRAAVNISRLRSSGTFQALARDPSISLSLQYLGVSASRLYLLFGRLREGVRPYHDGAPDVPVAEDLDELRLLSDEAGGPQLLRAYRIIGEIRELSQIHGRIERRPGVRVPAPGLPLEARESALKGHLTTLVGGVRLRARARPGALVAAPACLAVSAARAAPDALARFPRAWRRRKFRSEERRVGKECRSRWSPYH